VAVCALCAAGARGVTGRVANWRGRAARAQQYFEQGEVLGSKVKSLLVITAALKILGLSTWLLVALAPLLIAGYVAVGYVWVKHGWYAHGTEINALDRWTPVMVWDRWMQVRMLEKLGVELNHFPADQLPEAFTRVMASTQRGRR